MLNPQATDDSQLFSDQTTPRKGSCADEDTSEILDELLMHPTMNNLTPSLRCVSQKFGDVAVLPAETNANRFQTRHLDEIFTRIDMRYLSGVHCDVDGNMVEVPPQWGHDDDTT
ncbi:hypothetical protein E4U24_003559 [Claviceps purpurea]|nr:hypothetical protein E4U24_003559 [Claviceps purpurea]